MEKSSSKSKTTCNDSLSNISTMEQMPISDVVKFLNKRVTEDFLFQMATDIKLKEIEKELVSAFQVSFSYLDVIDSTQSYIADMIVVGDKIIGQNRLTDYPTLKEITLSKGELILIDPRSNSNSRFNIPLIDNYIMMYDSACRHQITITVHKMLIKKAI